MSPFSPIFKVNEIRLRRQNYAGCFLIVEGEDDRKFFNQLVNFDSCQITVASGKSYVVEIVSILERQEFSGYVGVVDADLDHVEQNTLESDNLIVLETVDLEALMIKSSALDDVLIELGSTKKINEFGEDVRELLLSRAVWVGCLRLYSYRANLNLKLQGLKYAKFIDRQILKIDVEALVQEVLNRSQRPNLSNPDIVEEIKMIHQKLTSNWLICYGKDMLEVLSFGLRNALGTNKEQDVKPDTIRQCLRLAFHRDDLEKSKLGQDLIAWEARNSGFEILPRI